MRTFCRVAELANFSRAARQLGLSPAVVSRQVGALEADLGVRLLHRSTRYVGMTEAGTQYYDASVELLDRFDELEAQVTGHAERPTGLLRVTAPLDFGLMYLRPAIREFLSREPGIRAEVHFDDRVVDLLAEYFDVAVRIGQLPDSSLVARKLGEACTGCYASPDYLALHGEPDYPEALGEHQVLEYALARARGSWQFRRAGQNIDIPVHWRISANSGRALADAAAEGLGIVRLPEFLVSEYVHEGRLTEILADYRSEPLAISLLYHHRRFNPAKIQVFADFLQDHFADLQR
tara:strand:+ start:534 stop:1409 length:876 start_codon:yes stop_codon:yes gene_type:complete